jgi:CRISPR/Cas system-associated endonuclease Cas3-HD
MEHRGCCAYEGRPLACRLMGAYVPHNNTLIQDCVYKNPVVYTKVEEIPLWNDFMKLMRKYPSPPGYFVKEGQQC